MQFFHVSITLVAQELVVTAQIEKKVDFITFEQYGQFISVFLIKKGTFFQEFQIFTLAYQARKWVKSVQMSNVRFFPTYTYQMACFDILVAF